MDGGYGVYRITCLMALVHISLHITPVHSSCTACVVGTPKSLCTDEYIPSGPESKACDSISQVLCKKYGNYEIFCTTLTTDVYCKKVGFCSGVRLAPGLVLISVVLAFVIKIVH